MRRHVPTVNALWGNQASILLGDYLFTHAFHLASTLGDARACRIIGAATNRVCDGELQQICRRGNLDLGEEEYFEIIDGKTAELTACCCTLGAIYAGTTDEVDRAPDALWPLAGHRVSDCRRPARSGRRGDAGRANRWAPIWSSKS